jgi:2-polyprenyl-3-methyl-5-hydroxy-6-metoxy-1,4-benzoquinol methylase
VEIRRIALIFDDTVRPETSGVYCRSALSQMAEITHFRPADLYDIPRRGFDLYLNIDDGLQYGLPGDLRPSAWWAIDTHVNFDWCLEKACDFDWVFATQRDGAAQLEAARISPTLWLPLACDADVHRKFDVEKLYDVVFVGNLFPGPRSELIEQLQRRLPNMFVGQAYFEEMAKIFSASRIVFNRSIRNDINMRVFEALGSGSFLLTNDLRENGQEELFKDGVHLATYQDADDLLDKGAYYLKHDRVRERIAAAGRAEVIARHTYCHRMQEMLERISQAAPRVRVLPAAVPAAPVLDGTYYEFSRPELLALIPHSARRVLEVGCGAGRLGESLKARQPAEVIGIEYSAPAAERAKQRLDRVVVGDAEQWEPDSPPDSLDCVVCGDVLEHMVDPERFLNRARSWLATEGVLIASIPNVRHHSVVSALLGGNWTYESAGLLDETHLNFFTRRDMLGLFDRAGYKVEQLGIVPGPGYDDWQQQGCPGEVKVGGLHIANMPREEAEEFFVYQYLLTAKAKTPEPLRKTEPATTRVAIAQLDGGSSSQKRKRRSRKRPPMRFTQDFERDFDQIDFTGRKPFAFVRFGDGERSICRGVPITAVQDGWAYDGKQSQFSADLNAALTYSAPDYYVGISDGCCDQEARDWFLERVQVPLQQITFANIFVNGNYRRFKQLDLSGTALVSSEGGDFAVPGDLINGAFDFDGLVERLLRVDRPILVAAGPASCVIIHKYWLKAVKKQTIVDVGSALDEKLKGRKTRRYQVPGSPTAERICQW